MALDDIWAQQMGNTKLLQVFHTRSYTPYPSNILNASSPPINSNFYKSWIIAIFIKGKYSTPWEYNNKSNGKYTRPTRDTKNIMMKPKHLGHKAKTFRSSSIWSQNT